MIRVVLCVCCCLLVSGCATVAADLGQGVMGGLQVGSERAETKQLREELTQTEIRRTIEAIGNKNAAGSENAEVIAAANANGPLPVVMFINEDHYELNISVRSVEPKGHEPDGWDIILPVGTIAQYPEYDPEAPRFYYGSSYVVTWQRRGNSETFRDVFPVRVKPIRHSTLELFYNGGYRFTAR